MKAQITQGQLLTLATSPDNLKMFLFEKMMQPKVAEFHKANHFILSHLNKTHQALISKFFERNEDGSIKYDEGYKNCNPEVVPEPIYKEGMTKDMFVSAQKEWAAMEKTIEV